MTQCEVKALPCNCEEMSFDCSALKGSDVKLGTAVAQLHVCATEQISDSGVIGVRNLSHKALCHHLSHTTKINKNIQEMCWMSQNCNWGSLLNIGECLICCFYNRKKKTEPPILSRRKPRLFNPTYLKIFFKESLGRLAFSSFNCIIHKFCDQVDLKPL